MRLVWRTHTAMSPTALRRANVGCGSTPTPGWMNLDNSLTVRLAQLPFIEPVLSAVLSAERLRFIRAIREGGVRWATATKLPLPDESLEVLYSSHMLEHLDRSLAQGFLREAWRVLEPRGVLRLAVPDLESLAQDYVETGDADRFVAATLLATAPAASVRERLKAVLIGHRGHAWMYDGPSLSNLVREIGFVDVRVVKHGETRIIEPGSLNLHERADESVYVEATRP